MKLDIVSLGRGQSLGLTLFLGLGRGLVLFLRLGVGLGIIKNRNKVKRGENDAN